MQTRKSHHITALVKVLSFSSDLKSLLSSHTNSPTPSTGHSVSVTRISLLFPKNTPVSQSFYASCSFCQEHSFPRYVQKSLSNRDLQLCALRLQLSFLPTTPSHPCFTFLRSTYGDMTYYIFNQISLLFLLLCSPKNTFP